MMNLDDFYFIFLFFFKLYNSDEEQRSPYYDNLAVTSNLLMLCIKVSACLALKSFIVFRKDKSVNLIIFPI